MAFLLFRRQPGDEGCFLPRHSLQVAVDTRHVVGLDALQFRLNLEVLLRPPRPLCFRLLLLLQIAVRAISSEQATILDDRGLVQLKRGAVRSGKIDTILQVLRLATRPTTIQAPNIKQQNRVSCYVIQRRPTISF